ncbi:MAG: hypothetical protein AB9834_00435 [Lentimicrobium sp.]
MATIQVKRYKFEVDMPNSGLKPGEFLLALDTGNTFICLSPVKRKLLGAGTKTEILTGQVNGANRVFTTSSPYVAGKIEVYLNGLKEVYFEESSDTTITLEEPPKNNGFADRIEATYTLKT